MLEYANAYLEGGNRRLAVFRDSEQPTFVAREFESMVGRMPELGEYLPDLKRYLLEFPKAALAGSTSFMYWHETDFGLKPTIRVNHLVIQETPGGATVASKQIYASHYFWTALEVRLLVADPTRGEGFYFVNVNRCRGDGLSGFMGRLIRSKVRSAAQKSLHTALMATKRALEQSHQSAR